MKKTGFAVLGVILLICLAACGGAEPVTELPPVTAEETRPAATPEPTPEGTPEPTSEPTPEPEPDIRSISITVAGDIVLHTELYADCLQPDGSYDFSLLFEDVAHYVADADYALCCFEGALTGDGKYTGYPFFRAPDDLAYSLKDVGFDLVALASNHGMDGFQEGLIRTIDVMEEAGLDHTGTYRSQEERDECGGVLLKEINGIRIAFLNYTYGTNGIPMEGFAYAMNVYYKDYMDHFTEINYGMLDEDMAYAKSLEPDLIAVIMHWGAEYDPSKQAAQEEAADYLFSIGADLILGGHPHVPQPMELVELDKGDGTTRTGYVCYCLGNLISAMHASTRLDTVLTAMVDIEISKNFDTGETVIEDVSYVPMAVVDTYAMGAASVEWQYRIWDLKAAMADYEAGNDRGIITPWMYHSMETYLERIRTIMGTELEAE